MPASDITETESTKSLRRDIDMSTRVSVETKDLLKGKNTAERILIPPAECILIPPAECISETNNLKKEEAEIVVKKILPRNKMQISNKELTSEQVSPSSGNIKITNTVFTTSTIKYLIKIDGDTFAFADTEQDAKLIVASVAENEVKNYEKEPSTKVLREVLRDGMKVHVCTQKVGALYNGSIQKRTILEITPVPMSIYVPGETPEIF